MAQVVKSSGSEIDLLNLGSNFANFGLFSSVHLKPYLALLHLEFGKMLWDKVVSLLLSFSIELESPQSEIVGRCYDRNAKHCHMFLENNFL